MIAQVSERSMHRVRWLIASGWLLLIASLFYDPWSAKLTEPDHPWSPLRLTGECVQVQGKCVIQEPYPLGATIFWGAVVPAGIFILLVFGHELWRRICPLSFLSQIPRALGWQRQFKRENQQTGKVRYELAKVKSDSWLGRNYSYVQFAYLFVGISGRILFYNADRLVLGGWLLFTIVFAIAVGYFYGGKSWCQYFCPMAPVQTVFSEPRGLLGSKAHMSEQRVTQSMCRTVLPDGNEQSACVACQSPCFDIDSERTYWDGLNQPQESLLRYGYLGLVVGYFVYYYLYAGNWNYYFSGVWNRDPNQLAALMNPGLYLWGQPIGIPKLFAVPLVLGAFTAIGYFLGKFIEHRVKSYCRQYHPNWNLDLIQNRIFALCTFIAFNFFFIFAARPLILLTPIWVQHIYDLTLVLLSTLWLNQTWRRSPDLYSRENLASRFRKQLEKLQLDVSQYLDGRSLDDLHTNEVYVLAKVLPGFTREKRHEAYKGVVREALEEGYANTSSSLEVLRQMRQELSITDDEHREVLEELDIENPELLNPDYQWTLENQIRRTGYKKSLERLITLQQRQPDRPDGDSQWQPNNTTLRNLRREYSITPQEEEWILDDFATGTNHVHKVEYLLARLTDLDRCRLALQQPSLQANSAVTIFLKESIHHKQQWLGRSTLETLALIKDDPKAIALAQSLHQRAPDIVTELLQQDHWRDRLHPTVIDALAQLNVTPIQTELSTQDSVSFLELLLQHYNPLVQAVTLYVIHQLDSSRAQTLATDFKEASHPLVQNTATQVLSAQTSLALKDLPQLEKLVYLANTDLFHRLAPETLIALSDRAEVKTYATNDVITDAGDTFRELLLLIEGNAKIQHQVTPDDIQVEHLQPGQMLDELEVLTRSNLENTIIADSQITRILTVPVDAFDDLLNRYPDFAPRVLELESRYLQQFVRSQ